MQNQMSSAEKDSDTEHQHNNSPDNLDPQVPNNKKEKEIPVVSMEDFEVVDVNDKLNLLMAAFNKINTNFHHKFESLTKQLTEDSGIVPRLTAIEAAYEELLARVDDGEGELAKIAENKTSITKLEDTVAHLQDDIAVLKGFVQVQDCALTECKSRVIDLTARSMSNNIIISGIVGDQEAEKDCKDKVLKFLKEKLKMEVEENEVEVTHRLGKIKEAKPQPIVVRCVFVLRQHIFDYTKNLKDLKNPLGDYYGVKPQLPEPLLSEKIYREE